MDLLRQVPDDSVHCVVTSPPYWGLRDYGLPPSIWGGEADCDHVWGQTQRGKRKDLLPADETRVGRVGTDDRQGHAATDGGRFCVHCGAWQGCLGLEPTPDLYVEHLVAVFRRVRRVLRPDGVAWLNLGDSYNTGTNAARQPSRSAEHGYWSNEHDGVRRAVDGLKPKDLLGIPWRVALALQADGWHLRCDIVWAKPNPMPESVTDRPTRAHEFVFLFAKSERYWYDADAIKEPLAPTSLARIAQESFERQTGGPKDYGAESNRSQRKALENLRRKTAVTPHASGRRQAPEPGEDGWADADGRNARSVWAIATQPFPQAHFATFPEALVRRCILSGCPGGGTVLDPFGGSGTVGLVAARHDRNAILFDLNPDYCDMARRRVWPEVQPRLALGAHAPPPGG